MPAPQVHEGDFFWDKNARQQWPSVAEDQSRQLAEYREAIAEINRTTGAGINPDAVADDMQQVCWRTFLLGLGSCMAHADMLGSAGSRLVVVWLLLMRRDILGDRVTRDMLESLYLVCVLCVMLAPPSWMPALDGCDARLVLQACVLPLFTCTTLSHPLIRSPRPRGSWQR